MDIKAWASMIQWTAVRRVIICIVTVSCVGVSGWIFSTNKDLTWSNSNRVIRDEPNECNNRGTWNNDTKTCKCTLGWIGKHCSTWHDHYCYFDTGRNYRGQLSVTKSGLTCEAWTTARNQQFKMHENGVGIHNYCRNPDDDENGIWCYVAGDNVTDYCNATKCEGVIRDWLMRNASGHETVEDKTPAVEFLFGPLIAGVCVGVVALLMFITIIELARRKRRQQQQQLKIDQEKHARTDESEIRSSLEIANERTDLKTLGGVVTVDVDTGKERILKPLNRPEEFYKSLDASTHGRYDTACPDPYFKRDGFARSPRSPHKGPPPPYQAQFRLLESIVTHSTAPKKSSVSTQHHGVRHSPVRSDRANRIEENSQNIRFHRKRRRRKRAAEPPSSSSDSDESLSMSHEDSSTSNGLSSPTSVSSKVRSPSRRHQRRKPRKKRVSSKPAPNISMQTNGGAASCYGKAVNSAVPGKADANHVLNENDKASQTHTKILHLPMIREQKARAVSGKRRQASQTYL